MFFDFFIRILKFVQNNVKNYLKKDEISLKIKKIVKKMIKEVVENFKWQIYDFNKIKLTSYLNQFSNLIIQIFLLIWEHNF